MTIHRDQARYWAESNIQAQIVTFLDRSLPPYYRVHSTPNGRYAADPKTVVRLKREGLKRGVPDLYVICSDGTHCALEVKAGTGQLSPEQREWLDWIAAGGGRAAVVRSLDEAVAALVAWGVPLRGRIAA